MTNSPAAIVVIFNPHKAGLEKLLDSLVLQVSSIFIIDNGSSKEVKTYLLSLGSSVQVMTLDQNMGIAHAQNCGIHLAQSQGAESLIFFDQDSIPSHNMIQNLSNALFSLESSGLRVAAVGPRFVDERSKTSEILHDSRDAKWVMSETLISSGSLIPMKVLNQVGLMTEELFIDYVDLDWCLRAKKMGFESYLVNDALMFHSLGDHLVKFMGKEWPSRSPLRHYYMCRNAIWMYRRSWPSLRWKLFDAFKLIRKIIFYTLFATPRVQQVQMMCLGLWHGMIGKMGKYSP